MKTRTTPLTLIIVIAILLLASAFPLHAQAVPQDAGGESFQNHGEVTGGYRFADVSGYYPQYLQLFYLKDGFRLFDFTVHGDSPDRSSRFADGYSLSASGLGGDPFSTAELQVGKTNLYDFRVQWRQSHYYWNQDDNVVLPITKAAPTLSTGLTANHDWATTRKLGSAAFTIHATNRLRFDFDFVRTTTNGPLLTTRSLDFFNSPMYWGSFARANPYPLNAPLHDETNRIAGGVDYSWRDWDFHYKGGFQSFDETIALNATTGEVSINPALLSASEPLTQLSWSQTRRLTTPVSEFSYRGRLRSDLEARGGYTYARYRGPATLDMLFSGVAPDAAALLTPYTVSEGGRTFVTEPNHDVNQGFTWKAKEWWAINIDYRYLRQTSESTATVQSVFNGTFSFGASDVVWRNGLSDLTFDMVFTPRPNLVLSPGIRLSKSDIETLENGVVDDARTLRTNHVRPEFRFSYRPLQKLSFRGDLYSATNGASYTAITPHTRLVARVAARYELLPNLSIENDLNISSARLVDSNYHNRIRANTITVSYALNERFSTYGSMGYESFFADGNIVYARTSLTRTIRDQEIHRVWQAGIDVKPLRYVGIRASANFDRLTGAGEILGEPPAYGPVSWPLGTGTIYFEIPKTGRLSLDFQRTYYSEEIVPVNNFSANLLTVRFTRAF